MKLLICTQTIDKNDPILGFFIGWVLEFSKHFAEIHVICLKKGEYDFPPHVFVYSLGKEEGENRIKYLYRFYKYFWYIFFRVKVDFVFYHMGEIYNILGAPFFFVRGQTKFYWWKAHGYINLKARLALNFVDRVYTSTQSGFSINTPKKHVVGQAIDEFKFVFPKTNNRNREIIFVGRISPVKRLEDFIETARILSQSDLSVTFRIIGPVSTKAYMDTLNDKINQAKLSNKITFSGPKNQVELVAIYQQAFLFLNTSVTHSMDKTVVEALMCGCLAVTGNQAFAELFSGTKLYTTEAEPTDYAMVIGELLKQNNDSLVQELRRQVIKSHSLTTFTKRIFNI